VPNGRDSFVEQIASILAAELDRSEHPADAVVRAATRQALLVHLQRNHTARARLLRAQTVGLSEPKLVRVLNFVGGHIGVPITLEDMAGIAAVGRYHFVRMFKLAVGMTPMAYVERARGRGEAVASGGRLRLPRSQRSSALPIRGISPVGFAATLV
jgi:AraC-like DNA-binding protein